MNKNNYNFPVVNNKYKLWLNNKKMMIINITKTMLVNITKWFKKVSIAICFAGAPNRLGGKGLAPTPEGITNRVH